ncbi:putative colanic acid biosynthesis acetyltransferase WcaF [Granulicella rosea]|uniref:Putative colanic acid biosynthesis acetyltransferase WcaF n=1 Tax=Granulicella rosea TaxID=474952 RepID=A0A239MLJ6_9BACT|nr:putative colanic acid biosynthesis acetyltransferase [Granulicella rosea]SNT43350.1 putative colanic acid biosynthesis acetyltransferase WcaF [Granulicella rosea]
MHDSGGQRRYQDLSRFTVPANFRGKPAWFVQIWWIVQTLLFHPSPQGMYGWRAFLLRAFGAKIGKNVIIRPSVSIVYPWNLSIGDYAWVGDETVLYTLGRISIGNHAVVSQRSYLCAGSHDSTKIDFTITNEPISIEDECWIASDVFVCPGVNIGFGTIVAARSTVTRSLPSDSIAMGSPARVVAPRKPSHQ